MKQGCHLVGLLVSLVLAYTVVERSHAIPPSPTHPQAPHSTTIHSPDLAIRLEIARKNYEYYQQLYQAGAISQQERDQAAQNYQMILQMTRSSAPTVSPQPLSPKAARQNQRASLEAQLIAAEATVQFTQQDYQRYQALYQEGAISRSQLEHRQKVYQEALIKRNRLQVQLQQRP